MDFFRRNDRVRRIENNWMPDDNYFQQRRWKLVTLLEQSSGFWPHQSKIKQYPLQLFHLLVMLSLILAEGNKMREFMGVDTDMVVEIYIFMAFVSALVVKLIFGSLYQNSRQKSYERIVGHFALMTDPEEMKILEEHAEEGFQYTAVFMCKILKVNYDHVPSEITVAIKNYTDAICITIGTFDSVPILKSFYNYFTSPDGEFKLILPLPTDYGIDHKKYWYIVAFDYLMAAVSGFFANCAFDLSFILQVRHAQALFKIVGLRLKKASEFVSKLENEGIDDNTSAADDSYALISSAIDLHSECLEVVDMIEKTYTSSWFVVLLLSTAAFGAFVHTVSTKLHDPIELFRYSCLYILIIMHFHIIYSQGQLINDCSTEISYACYDCKWYGLPKKSSKLLSVMMVRTAQPCGLTGGKLFPLSMETFGKMLKTGLSYYTVFES